MSRSIESELAGLRSASLFRRLRELDSAQQPVMLEPGGKLTNFSSNDYLGLANAPRLRDAAKEAIDTYGIGAGASRLVCGTLKPHLDLERRLAEFKGTQAALAFSSGYAAATGTIPALVGREDVIIIDKLSHASLVDGARLSGAVLRVFPHNHLGKLESHLRWARHNHPEARLLVVTESVFSMDGDRAPLAQMVEIKEEYEALLLLDEAHAVGVIGKNGRGLADELGIVPRIDVQMGTLSKALGVSGGYICGSRVLIDLLINRARSFIYSTAPPPALAAAAVAALDLLESDDGAARRDRLWQNIRRFSAQLPERLRPAEEPGCAIVPLIVGPENRALAAAHWLYEKRFLVPAIRYPTVARGSARLRVTLSAAHTDDQIDGLTKALREQELV